LVNEQQKDEQQALIISHFSASLDELTLLASCIERPLVKEMIRTSKLLKQHFAGFRPDKPQWNRVPGKLAQFAFRSSDKTNWLIKNWFLCPSNNALFERAKELVEPEDIRKGVGEILAQSDGEVCQSLLCALLLDERPEVREGVTDGLRRELLDQESDLVREAQKRRQELEQEREANRQLQEAQDEATHAHSQLEERSQQLEELQTRFLDLENRAEEAEKLLAQARSCQESAEHERDEERLAAQIANTKEREADATRGDLERQNAQLQAQLKPLAEMRERAAELETHQIELEDLRKKAENRSRHFEREHQKAQRALDDERKHPRYTVSLALLDESWRESLVSIATHLRATSMLPVSQTETSQNAEAPLGQGAAGVAVTDRAGDWCAWQQMETRFARQLLEDGGFDFELAAPDELEDGLSEAKRAQRLLMVRWYLLEGFRLRLLESLQAANVANGAKNGKGGTS